MICLICEEPYIVPLLRCGCCICPHCYERMKNNKINTCFIHLTKMSRLSRLPKKEKREIIFEEQSI